LVAMVLFHVEVNNVGVGLQPRLGGIPLVANRTNPGFLNGVVSDFQMIDENVIVDGLELALVNFAVVDGFVSPGQVVYDQSVVMHSLEVVGQVGALVAAEPGPVVGRLVVLDKSRSSFKLGLTWT